MIAQISDDRPPRQAWLGIAFSSVDSESAAVQLGLDSSTRGAAVTVVYPGGPADKADMAVGDVIIAADDVPIRNANALTKLIAQRKIGDELDLELIDSRGPRLVTVEGGPGGRRARYRRDVSPQRPSGRRFAAFLVALALAASAFGGLVLPRFADAELPASMKAKPTLIKQKLEDKRCRNEHVDAGT